MRGVTVLVLVAVAHDANVWLGVAVVVAATIWILGIVGVVGSEIVGIIVDASVPILVAVAAGEGMFVDVLVTTSSRIGACNNRMANPASVDVGAGNTSDVFVGGTAIATTSDWLGIGVGVGTCVFVATGTDVGD